MKIPFFQIDAFADRPFSGNPAAVFPLDEWLPDDVMQSIANEMNLSESAFFVPRSGATNEFDLRWFTPTVEVDLCGHATLASGYVALKKLVKDSNRVRFFTRSGWLGVESSGDLLILDFPINSPSPIEDQLEISAVAEAVGSRPIAVLSANTTVAVFENESDVADLMPDFQKIAALREPWLAATAPADSPEIDFVSRFFVPTAGINEDPVTGSSHTILAPYWAGVLGKNELIARQISRRGGTLYCRVEPDRVKIAGKSVEVIHGEITI